MNPKLTDVIRFALRIRTQRFRRSPYLCLLALAVALPSFAATLKVTNTNDSGTGSLRNAIATANPGDTITFSVTGTITLTSGTLTIDKSLTITGPGAAQLAIDGNQANQVFFINPSITVTISGLTIQNGVVNGNGGGIFNQGSLTLTNSKVSGNSAANSGGGIDNEFSGTLTMINSTVSGNTCSPSGDAGGIENSGTATLTNSTVAGNSTPLGFGGGMQNFGTLTLTNSTISGNSSDEGGGAIENEAAITITNSTVSGNSSSGTGGGIDNDDGTITLKSTLLANNGSGGNCVSNPYVNATITSLGYNLSDDTTCQSALTQTTDKNNTPAGLDPKGLQNNGGPTQTIALLPTSPAVDAIPVAACTDANGNPVKTDQRGVTRPQGNGCDIGAYELVQAIPFSNFSAYLAIDTGRHPGLVLTSIFTLGSGSTGLQPANEAMTLEIANYTLTLPAGSFHKLWNAPNAPYGYEGTVNGAKLVLGIVPLGHNTFSFDAAGSPVSFAGVKNPVTVTLIFGNDSGTVTVNALLASY